MASLDEQFIQQLQQLQGSSAKTPVPRLPTFSGQARIVAVTVRLRGMLRPNREL